MLGVLPFVEDPDLSWSAAPALPQHLPPCLGDIQSEGLMSQKLGKDVQHVCTYDQYKLFFFLDVIAYLALTSVDRCIVMH